MAAVEGMSEKCHLAAVDLIYAVVVIAAVGGAAGGTVGVVVVVMILRLK